MKEEFLHYLWQLGKFDLHDLRTTEGLPITILRRGQLNHNAGPDFLNGSIKIGKLHWEGNIEIHIRSGEWNDHKHDTDEAYNNVILHVVLEKDKEVYTKAGNRIPTLELRDRVPAGILGRYKALSASLEDIPCHKQLPKLDQLRITHWLERLAVQRLEHKSNRILKVFHHYQKDWEQTAFHLWGKYMGGKVNEAAFSELAERVDVRILWKNKPFIQQLEAYLFGMAGLLPLDTAEVYPNLLKREYAFLEKKWKLKSMRTVNWRFFRMRPSNFPTIRIAQLAKIYHEKGRWLPWLLEAGVEELEEVLRAKPSIYWQDHYLFGRKSENANTTVGKQQFNKLLINVVIPLRFAYAGYHDNTNLKLEALDLLEQLPAENNRIVRDWKEKGIHSGSAMDSQALIELKTNWCRERQCLKCEFGNYFLRSKSSVDKVEETFVTLMSR